ncbi:MAG: class I SAM-dependent methyltransferase [Pseudomonadota bacterium]
MSGSDDPSLDAAYGLTSPEDNKRLYRTWAETYDTGFASESGYRFPALIAGAYLEAGGTWPAVDAGCGTGLIADFLPDEAVVDGLDISAEMLAQAGAKGRYRNLMEADLTGRLDLPGSTYAGLLSAGTFTHGHVGPEALDELLRILRPGAVCAISGNLAFYRVAGFADAFERLKNAGKITGFSAREERIYTPGANAPMGHGDDMGLVIVFRKAG